MSTIGGARRSLLIDTHDTMTGMNAYGEVDPCPNCGSTNVRWRRRRFSDVVLTHARYLADLVVSTLFGTGQTRIAGSSGSRSAGRANLQAVAYSESRQF